MNCRFEEEIQTQNFNTYKKQTNKLFSEENDAPEHCLTLEQWQGPPHINKVKPYRLCRPLRSVSFFSLFSQENKKELGFFGSFFSINIFSVFL